MEAPSFAFSQEDDIIQCALPSALPGMTPLAKVINDPIHGHFELPSHVLALTDTPHVQRLRELKQLGGTYLVFPGASHNRFEHSLGVSYLSGHFARTLYSNRRDDDARKQFDSERTFGTASALVELAGLAHDLGHGPHSHTFDHCFLPAICNRRSLSPTAYRYLQHEQRSVAMFEHCVDTYSLDIEREHVRLIGNLITGSHHKNSIVPPFMFQIVANAITGIDTDKFDYLARDVYNVGLQGSYGFDYRRLMKFAKVIGDNICFHRKELFNVYHLFLTRYQLHRAVYNHRAAIAIDAMVTDALLHADETFRIADSIEAPEDFIMLSDCIIPQIEFSKNPQLKHSKNLIHRLRRRKLYRFADEILLPTDCIYHPVVRSEDITTCQDAAGAGVTLIPDDVHVAKVSLNFGMKERNPVDRVPFFKNWGDTRSTTIPSEKASYVMPRHWEERLLRVYLKRDVDGDERRKYVEAVRIAFRKYLRRAGLSEQVHSPNLTNVIDRPSTTTTSEYNQTIIPNANHMHFFELQSAFTNPPEQTVPSPTPVANSSDDDILPLPKRPRQFVK